MSEKVSKTKTVAKRKPFEESLHGLLHDMFRAANVPIDSKQNDNIRATAERLASLIQAESKLASIAHMKRLQKAIIAAFEAQDKKIDLIAKRSSEPPLTLAEIGKKF